MLYYVESANGYLECKQSNGYAISEPYVKVPGDLDEIVVTWEYKNIREDLGELNTPDVLCTLEVIANGDQLVIYHNDVIHEMIAVGVYQEDGLYKMDTTSITAGELCIEAFLVNKSVQIDFGEGDGFEDLVKYFDTFTYNVNLTSITEYKDIRYHGTSLTKINFSAAGNKMLSFVSKLCGTVYNDCFITADNFKIQTKDNQYFCAVSGL